MDEGVGSWSYRYIGDSSTARAANEWWSSREPERKATSPARSRVVYVVTRVPAIVPSCSERPEGSH